MDFLCVSIPLSVMRNMKAGTQRMGFGAAFKGRLAWKGNADLRLHTCSRWRGYSKQSPPESHKWERSELSDTLGISNRRTQYVRKGGPGIMRTMLFILVVLAMTSPMNVYNKTNHYHSPVCVSLFLCSGLMVLWGPLLSVESCWICPFSLSLWLPLQLT